MAHGPVQMYGSPGPGPGPYQGYGGYGGYGGHNMHGMHDMGHGHENEGWFSGRLTEEDLHHMHLHHQEEVLEHALADDFKQPWEQKNAVAAALHKGGFAEHVYGGDVGTQLQELQLVKAWRPRPPLGQMQLATGVIHRVHHEDRTVTVQFPDDQHRVRIPFDSVKPMLDITPEYPTVRLQPGQNPPTPSQLERRHEQEAQMLQMGITPAPWADSEPSGAGAMVSKREEQVQRWGIPATTLDALRNRSIPAYQVNGEYGKHFYTNLYKNNFYFQKESGHRKVSESGHIGVDEGGLHGLDLHGGGPGGSRGAGGRAGGLGGGLGGRGGGLGRGHGGLGSGAAGGRHGLGGLMGGGGWPTSGADRGGLRRGDLGQDGVISGAGGIGGRQRGADLIDPSNRGGFLDDGTHVVSHHYIPLEGPELEQDLHSGRWYPLDGDFEA
mmetsp:Transcript_64604/g.140628  ORF Transcript_64604/g.140628 Transcript_64604/m.140628 type:complete len:438 (-) Transcript_64604:50-1363(-)